MHIFVNYGIKWRSVSFFVRSYKTPNLTCISGTFALPFPVGGRVMQV